MAESSPDLLSRIDGLLDRVTSLNMSEGKNVAAAAEETTTTPTQPPSNDLDKKMYYITRNLEEGEIMGDEDGAVTKRIREIVAKRPLKIYWGTATTGAPHIAYWIPLTKLGDFLKAGCEVTILLADLHAFLDAGKTPWDLLDARVAYYKAIIRSMLRAVNVPLERLKFVRGTDFQMSKEYTLDVYRLCAKTSVGQAQRAGADVVKKVEGGEIQKVKLAPIMYPLLQALDEHYLGVDMQFGGVDQRKIFAYASDFLEKCLGYPSRMHIMNPICPGLDGEKMSSSENNKVDPLESRESVAKKIGKSYCSAGNVERNGVLSFCKFVLFPCFLDGKPFVIERKEDTPLTFNTIQELTEAFKAEKVHPGDFKQATLTLLNATLDKVRADFASPEMQSLREKAYPTAKVEEVKVSDEAQWCLEYHKSEGKMPSLKEVRSKFSASKRVAKRWVQEAEKVLKTQK